MGPRALNSADLGLDPARQLDCKSETGLTPGNPECPAVLQLVDAFELWRGVS